MGQAVLASEDVVLVTGASQDFRDGAATGAATVAKRARTVASWGISLEPAIVELLAEQVAYEMGGRTAGGS